MNTVWVLIAINYGFWCSCVEGTKEIATFATRDQCEDSMRALPKSQSNSFAYLCTEKKP